MKLRPYQEECLAAIIGGFASYTRQLAILATGGGKTLVFSKAAQSYNDEKKKRVLILADTDELIAQAVEKLFVSTGIYAGVEKGEQKASLQSWVVVSSIQTMQRDNRLAKFEAAHFGLVIADEAHLSLSPGWLKVLNHFNGGGAHILGVTATPGRADNRPLMKFYENIAYELNLFDLVKMSYLVPIKVMTVPLSIDVSKVSKTKGRDGDFDGSELADVLHPYFDSIIASIKEHAPTRQILVFCPLRKTSQAFAERCVFHGISARHVDGESHDRKEIIHAHKEREFQVLCNAMLLTKGYDDPNIGCIINLRLTRHATLYQQIIGRGTRPWEGCLKGLDNEPPEARARAIAASPKPNLLILDFLWQFDSYAVMTPAHLLAKTEDEAKEITRRLEISGAKGEAKDLIEAESEFLTEQENRLIKKLKANQRRQQNGFDALEWAALLRDTNLQNYEPMAPWECEEPTEKQLMMLRNAGIDVRSVKGKGHASKLINNIKTRRDKKLATLNQLKHLIRFNVPDAHKVSFDDASKLLDHHFNSERNERYTKKGPAPRQEPPPAPSPEPRKELPVAFPPPMPAPAEVKFTEQECQLIQGEML